MAMLIKVLSVKSLINPIGVNKMLLSFIQGDKEVGLFV